MDSEIKKLELKKYRLITRKELYKYFKDKGDTEDIIDFIMSIQMRAFNIGSKVEYEVTNDFI